MAASKNSGRMTNKLKWVQCEKCNSWVEFDNCKRELGLEEFDQDKIDKLSFTCRMCRYEDRLDSYKHLDSKIEAVLGRIVELEQEIKVLGDECKSKFVVSEMRIEDECKRLSDKVDDLSGRATALGMKFEEVSNQWPLPSEVGAKQKLPDKSKKLMASGSSSGSSSNSSEVEGNKISFRDKYKNRSPDTVVVVGDSLARGVGNALERDSNMFSKFAYGGAKIETVEEKIRDLDEYENSHVVLVVGTNNLMNDGTEAIMGKFESLINETKKHKFRKVSFLGMLKRQDLNSYTECKRIGLNLRLKKLCEANNIGYIYKDLVTEHFCKDGLHLSLFGQDDVARVVFRHCKSYLN